MDRKRLARGLESLIRDNGAGLPNYSVPPDSIQANPYQPRKSFDADELAGLCASIRQHGILQPLVVRQLGERFQLIAGERRLRAAVQAGLTAVPIRLVDFNDQQVLEAALVENIQRSDLNPIEKAMGFKEHLDRFGMSHDQLAARLGLARTTITNLVSLLDLPAEIQEGLRLGQVTEGHAKILKGLRGKDKQVELFKQIVARGLSVKATEVFFRDQQQAMALEKEKEPEKEKPAERKTAHVKGLEDELRQRFATGVEIQLRGKDKGQFVVRFESNEDFERILELLRK